MVLGDPHHERVIVTDHRFVPPNGLEEVRDLILAGRRRKAQELHARGHHLQWTPSFHPGWAVTIDVPPHGRVRDYTRRTDFATGGITVAWADDAGRWSRRLIVSHADGAVVQVPAGVPVEIEIVGE